MTTQTASASTSVPSSPDASLLNVLDFMENLCHVYQEERDAMELRDMRRFSDLQHIKVHLVSECEQRIQDMLGQHGTLKNANPGLKERIRSTQETLNKLAMESARNCKIRAESTRRIQERLLDAARHIMNKNQKRYGKNGMSETSSRHRPTATAINEAI